MTASKPTGEQVKRKHRRTKKMMWSWVFEISTDYAPQTATVIEVIRQAFEQRGANVAIKEYFEPRASEKPKD